MFPYFVTLLDHQKVKVLKPKRCDAATVRFYGKDDFYPNNFARQWLLSTDDPYERVKVELKKDEPCDLTTSCFQLNGNSSGNNNVDGSALYYKRRKRSYNNDLNYAASRQTGENFRSASPPDCRVRTCQNG